MRLSRNRKHSGVPDGCFGDFLSGGTVINLSGSAESQRYPHTNRRVSNLAYRDRSKAGSDLLIWIGTLPILRVFMPTLRISISMIPCFKGLRTAAPVSSGGGAWFGSIVRRCGPPRRRTCARYNLAGGQTQAGRHVAALHRLRHRFLPLQLRRQSRLDHRRLDRRRRDRKATRLS